MTLKELEESHFNAGKILLERGLTAIKHLPPSIVDLPDSIPKWIIDGINIQRDACDIRRKEK